MSIVEEIREIVELVKKSGDEALLQKVITLQDKIIKLNREDTQLKIKLKNAHEKIVGTKKMVFKKPFYIQENDDQPFCAFCWETDHKAVHLTGPYGEMDGTKRYYSCTACKNWFYI